MVKLIIIYAHWCPICNLMVPIIEDIERKYEKKLQVEWIDVEKYPDAYEKYSVEIIPTFIIMQKEKEVARMSGIIGEDILIERIPFN